MRGGRFVQASRDDRIRQGCLSAHAVTPPILEEPTVGSEVAAHPCASRGIDGSDQVEQD